MDATNRDAIVDFCERFGVLRIVDEGKEANIMDVLTEESDPQELARYPRWSLGGARLARYGDTPAPPGGYRTLPFAEFQEAQAQVRRAITWGQNLARVAFSRRGASRSSHPGPSTGNCPVPVNKGAVQIHHQSGEMSRLPLYGALGVLFIRPCATIIPTGKHLPFVANGKYAIRVMWAGSNSEYPMVQAG